MRLDRKFGKERDFRGVTQSPAWLISCRNEYYNIKSAFQHLNEVDWRETVKYEVNDMVYIYCTKPYQKVMFQTVVQKINIPFDETIDDRFFGEDIQSTESQSYYYSRLKLHKYIDSDSLTLNTLLQHGLKMPPRRPMRLRGNLKNYIGLEFEKTALVEHIPLPEEIDLDDQKTYHDGAKKQITVNAYERNPIARSECIRMYGSVCIICGFDFGNFYGSELEGKIHVHHKKPLSQIDDSYEVNPKDDLVPVCPNCHMVLHSKKDRTYSIEDVKEMISKYKNIADKASPKREKR